MSIERIDLPGNAWAEFRPVEDVSERHRRAIGRLRQKMAHTSPEFVAYIEKAREAKEEDVDLAAVVSSLSPEGFEASEEMNDALIVALVASWSFDVPVALDSVLDLPTIAYQALLKAAAERGKGLFLNTEPTPDEESPTEP